MLLYNLWKYSSNYSETTGNLWFYCKNETNSFDAVIGNKNNFKTFENKTKILEDPAVDDKNAIIVVPFKYRCNFWRSLEIPLINFKIELKLRWTRNCFSGPSADIADVISGNIIFTIKDAKLYVLVITLLTKGNQKLS